MPEMLSAATFNIAKAVSPAGPDDIAHIFDGKLPQPQTACERGPGNAGGYRRRAERL